MRLGAGGADLHLRGVGVDLRAAPELVRERGGTLGNPMHLLAVTPSTNDEAHHGAKKGAPHGATWVAEEQTDGRGRRGRSWVSPRGEGLLFTVLLRVQCDPSSLPPLALVAGLAVRDAVAAAAPGADVRLKWPNDVLVGGRKVSGILVEAKTVGSRVEAVLAGIGINVHTRHFPPDIAARATSVALAAEGTPVDRAHLLADVLQRLDRDVHVVAARGLGLVRDRLEAADALRGKRVRNDGGQEGVATGIDDRGALKVVQDDGHIMAWVAGEVSIVSADGLSP